MPAAKPLENDAGISADLHIYIVLAQYWEGGEARPSLIFAKLVWTDIATRAGTDVHKHVHLTCGGEASMILSFRTKFTVKENLDAQVGSVNRFVAYSQHETLITMWLARST